MVMYFFIMIIVTFCLIVTIVSNRMSRTKKIINATIFSMMYLCFMSVAAIAASNKLDLSVMSELYQNENLLSFIQISNILFSFWLEYTVLYFFYRFLEYKLDKNPS